MTLWQSGPLLWQVVVVVTNHTDEDSGDMFLGPDETGKGHAATVDQFFNILWAPFRELLDGAIVYFASCGSLVSQKDSLTMLKASVEELLKTYCPTCLSLGTIPQSFTLLVVRCFGIYGLTKPTSPGDNRFRCNVINAVSCKSGPVCLGNGLYLFECIYASCGYKGLDRVKEVFSFVVACPNCEVLLSKRQTPMAWLKEVFM
ncbi:hypothetical protein L210DRAFT_933603 [Boletus edulis BED1]|uniref:Uncharacterized protein n=1 Tax=Boletus edulis BED1 TaxID=1328754 RepID=A0AAD4G8S3_BOLED|nr:hypothetical protein L210DRAFT_933603 [Boletus edulis BED1]